MLRVASGAASHHEGAPETLMKEDNLRFRMRNRHFLPGILLLLLPVVPAHAQTAIQQGFNRLYNLDFSGAHQSFDTWEKTHPTDPMGPVSHAADFLFAEFDRLGVLQSQFFIDDNRYESRKKEAPDPNMKTKFDQALNATDDLSSKALAANPDDSNAQFAKVFALGLRSDYAALIERRDLAAISYTKQSRAIAEQLLKEKPDAYDAYLAVGIENYLSGIKPAPVRWMLQLGGVQTDKEAGLRDLELTAAHGDLLAPFARLLLAVAALRDKDTAKACNLLSGLSARYPQNSLYRNEKQQRCH